MFKDIFPGLSRSWNFKEKIQDFQGGVGTLSNGIRQRHAKHIAAGAYLVGGKDATFEFFSIIDNRLCINRLIIDNRNLNPPVGSKQPSPSQSGSRPAPTTPSRRRNTVSVMAPAAVHRAWEKQATGDAAADVTAARSNSVFTR